MSNKIVAISVDEIVSQEFKASCAKEGISMSQVVELFMRAYNAGRFRVEIQYERNQLEEK